MRGPLQARHTRQVCSVDPLRTAERVSGCTHSFHARTRGRLAVRKLSTSKFSVIPHAKLGEEVKCLRWKHIKSKVSNVCSKAQDCVCTVLLCSLGELQRSIRVCFKWDIIFKGVLYTIPRNTLVHDDGNSINLRFADSSIPDIKCLQNASGRGGSYINAA